MSRPWLCLCLAVLASGEAFPVYAADPPTDLANKAHTILKERCFACHGEGGSNEGGFNYVLNRKRLARELVVPGAPDDSRLFERVSKGEMPPEGDRVPKEYVETLRKWIDAGAPSFTAEKKRTFISPVHILGRILKDLEAANERDRPFYRYFTLTHLYNAGFEDNELESHRHGLSKLVNSLSWGREIKVPQPIDPFKTILRIDLRHYKWNESKAWDRIISADPYHVAYSDASAKKCYSLTHCERPHVRADWFVFAASRPPLYHDVLGIPAEVRELEKTVGVNVAQNLVDFNDVQRAAFFPSGVSKSNRLIERHVSSYGAYWKSYDFKPIDAKNPRRGNLKDTPLGPSDCGQVTDNRHFFQHDGGEIIFSLPNGLQAYMLIDANGTRIDKGPTDVVVDKEAVKRGRDPDVLNGVSCMSCHWSGMLNKTDQVREHVLARKTAYAAEVVEAVTALYSAKSDFAAKLQEDRERFEAAVKKCGAPLAKSEPVSTLAWQFDEPLDIDLAAAEAGVPLESLTKALDADAALGRTLGSLTQGQPAPRDTFVQAFGSLVKELKIGKFVAATSASRQGEGTRAGQEREDSDLKLKLVWCPAGTFKMGSPTLDKDALSDEQPQVNVTLSRGFWLGKYEVTQREWATVMATTPWKGQQFVKEGADYAVSYVSWEDAVRFCTTFTDAERKAGRISVEEEYRLPTEAEWEYACRAGKKTRYIFGDSNDKLSDYAWFEKNALHRGEEYAHQVGLKKANSWGLHDMHGNVWEWCSDWYDGVLAGGFDPTGSSQGSSRIYRGGGWRNDAAKCRSAIRPRFAPDFRDYGLGFRVVLQPTAKPVSPAAKAISGNKLLARIDLAVHSHSNNVKKEGDRVIVGSQSVLSLPFSTTGNYELEIDFVRTSGSDALVGILPVGKGYFTFGLSQEYGRQHTLMGTAHEPGTLQNGKHYLVRFTVKLRGKNGDVAVFLNGNKMLATRIAIAPYEGEWAGIKRDWIPAIRSQNATYELHSITLKRL